MSAMINWDDFAKVDLRVGRVVKAEVPEKSEKLIKLTVDFGEEERTILAGIKKWYQASDLEGKKFVFVYNLAVKKTPFGESQGMILAVGEEKPELLEIKEAKEGERVR